MAPAYQRLGSGDRPGLEIDLRLVMQHKFPSLEGAAQAAFEELALDGANVHLLVRTAQASHQTLRNRLQEFVADRVSERVVDVFEAIQIQKHHGVMLAVATGQGNRIVHKPVAAYENAVRGQPHGLVFFNGQCHRIGRHCACGAVDNPKYFGKGTTRGILAGLTRHGLRDCIAVGDVARDVGAENGVADGIEGDLRALLFQEKRLLSRLVLDHAAQSPRQPVVVEMILEQVILRATLCALRGDGFIFPGGQDQGRNQRGHREECLKRLDSLTIRQEQIEQDRGNSRLAQSAHAVSFMAMGSGRVLFDSKAPGKGLAWQSGASATARSVRQPI